MKEIEFKFAGIQFMVQLDVSMGDTLGDSVIESVMGVYTWNDKKREYEPISCDLEAFEVDLQDQIYQAFEEMYDAERLAHEDMMFDAMREREYEAMHNQ